MPGSSVRPFTPPKAEPFHTRPASKRLHPRDGTAPLAPRSGCLTRDELEGPRADLLARGRDGDNHARAPALVAALERGAHHVHVAAAALEAVVDAAVRHLDDGLLDRLVGVV